MSGRIQLLSRLHHWLLSCLAWGFAQEVLIKVFDRKKVLGLTLEAGGLPEGEGP
jgi:hypothetical protein